MNSLPPAFAGILNFVETWGKPYTFIELENDEHLLIKFLTEAEQTVPSIGVVRLFLTQSEEVRQALIKAGPGKLLKTGGRIFDPLIATTFTECLLDHAEILCGCASRARLILPVPIPFGSEKVEWKYRKIDDYRNHVQLDWYAFDGTFAYELPFNVRLECGKAGIRIGDSDGQSQNAKQTNQSRHSADVANNGTAESRKLIPTSRVAQLAGVESRTVLDWQDKGYIQSAEKRGRRYFFEESRTMQNIAAIREARIVYPQR
ncbi:hypothetical protein [Novipirellula caenicola]|uniref:HTH merR-type domain-containing protein n=1 Tax=Novipirellula caenicola TaxID=1536901 RepID=A0ABP9VZM9_9BACT